VATLAANSAVAAAIRNVFECMVISGREYY
jgi:hypothetical protein